MLSSAHEAPSPERIYRFRVSRPDGTIESGTVAASTADAAVAAIAPRGVWVLNVEPHAPSLFARRMLPIPDLALGLRLLASLLEAGLPLSRALAAWNDVVPETWHPTLPVIAEGIRHGGGLASALASTQVGIPPVVIGILRAGEAGSGLAPAVRRAASVMESAAGTRATIRAALAYPLILAAAGSTCVALLVGVVLPRFATILADLGQGLPPTTRIVLGAADLARAGAVPAAAVLAVVILVWRSWVATDAGRERWHALLLASPIVGPIRLASAAARYAQTLSALLESGVPIGSALRVAAESTGDGAIAVRASRARARVIRGERLAAALSAEDATTRTALRIVRAGEESGNLAEMLAHAAAIEHERVERSVKAATRLLEPALILAFGGLVAFVAAALLQAVYSVRPGA